MQGNLRVHFRTVNAVCTMTRMAFRFPFRRRSRTPRPAATRRFRLYWIALFASLVTPVLLGIPHLDDAVARASILSALLVVWQAVRTMQPHRDGPTAALQVGVRAFASALVLVFAVAGVYVARTGEAVPADPSWQPALLGALYIAAAHLGTAYLVRRRIPDDRAHGLSA